MNENLSPIWKAALLSSLSHNTNSVGYVCVRGNFLGKVPYTFMECFGRNVRLENVAMMIHEKLGTNQFLFWREREAFRTIQVNLIKISRHKKATHRLRYKYKIRIMKNKRNNSQIIVLCSRKRVGKPQQYTTVIETLSCSPIAHAHVYNWLNAISLFWFQFATQLKGSEEKSRRTFTIKLLIASNDFPIVITCWR